MTLVYRGDNILRGFDDDVRNHLRGEMEKRGIKIVTKAIVEGDREGRSRPLRHAVRSRGRRRRQGDVRDRPPSEREGLGLEAAGVKLDEKGAIAVNEFSQTSVPHIYAVGDVTDRIALTPVAIREGHAFADTVFGKKPTRVDHTESCDRRVHRARGRRGRHQRGGGVRRCDKVDIYKTSFRPMKATLSGRDTRMFMKLVVDGMTDRVVGCHIVGPEAGEMIQLVGIAVKMKATKADFDATMALHPTAAEELVTMREKSATHVGPPGGRIGLFFSGLASYKPAIPVRGSACGGRTLDAR